MNDAGWLVLAVVAAYGCAAAAAVVRYGFRGRVGGLASWCFVPVVAVCPLLIPSARVGMRAAAAVTSGDILFKMVDYFRVWGRIDRGAVLREYYGFLIPFPVFSAVYPDHKRRLRRPERPGPQVLRLVGGIVGFAAALAAVRSLAAVPLLRSSFALNHVAILPIFVVAIESLSRALCGLEHLAGFDTTPIIRDAYRSRTVAEFWHRYNNRIHEWLYRNVFRPSGGRRTPARSVLLVFLVSGLLHEAMFAVATSRVTGYQLAFFTIQGPAALASGRFERLARRGGIAGKVLAHGATILFLAATSVLFFDGVRRVFPFIYASRPPLP